MVKKKSSKKKGNTFCDTHACRPLQPLVVREELVQNLVASAQMAPSCFSQESWRFEFVYGERSLELVRDALEENLVWASTASMFVAVLASKRKGCVPEEASWHFFDVGIATGFMIMRGTDLGIVLEPLTGFDRNKVHAALKLDKDTTVVTLLAVGRYLADPVDELRHRIRELRDEREDLPV
ncbi:MAG: hypothetical protein QF415_01560 [Candidatus Undinarchaeales archaeon]|jgi:nitroreductase|nr:hypothetical protein [Candidatus Undinarchaeales archaeon]MDP7493393.1 hypothetical protein [Candidatus Undinarchaeales archaeon]